MKGKYSKPKVGSYVIDRRYPDPVGRLKKSSGLNNHKRFLQLLSSIDSVWERGGTQDLIALKNGSVSPVDFLSAYESGMMRGEDWNLLTKDLDNELSDFMARSDYAEATVNGYKNCILQLLRMADHLSSPTVSNLPRLLMAYREKCAKEKIYRSFDQTRAVCMAYARNASVKNKASGLYQDIRAIPIFGKKPGRKQAPNRPFTLQELDKLFFDAPPHIKRYEDWIWFLCLTGMGPKELLQDGFISGDDFIEILGKKRTSRQRRVPKIQEVPAGKKPSYMTLRRVMKFLGNRTPYDTRRTAIVWWDRAGIDRDHGTYYAGHEMTTTLRGRYKQEDVSRWLTEDAAKLSEWISTTRDEADLPTAVPIVIAQSSKDLGKSRQADSMADIKTELNNVLAMWESHGFLRNLYEVDDLIEIKNK
jgi:integrase